MLAGTNIFTYIKVTDSVVFVFCVLFFFLNLNFLNSDFVSLGWKIISGRLEKVGMSLIP